MTDHPSDDHAARVRPDPAAGEGPRGNGGHLIVIGITGRARTGKDLAAAALVYHRDCFRVALADGVKAALHDLDGPRRELTKALETGGKSLRWAWQVCGTECRLDVNAPGLWIHLLAAKIRFMSRYAPQPVTRFVVPDIRFRMEVSMLRHLAQFMGGSFGCLRLTRPGGPAIAEVAHVSETEPDTIRADREYENAGSMADLAAAAVAFFDDVAAGKVSGNF
jgi:hypothetical protein